MNDINNLDIRTHIIDAIVEVFDTMVSMEVQFFDSEPPDTTGTERMVATVNFAGNVVGIITIQVPSEMSRLMMAAMLDSEADKIEDERKIRDLIAEISNIDLQCIRHHFEELASSRGTAVVHLELLHSSSVRQQDRLGILTANIHHGATIWIEMPCAYTIGANLRYCLPINLRRNQVSTIAGHNQLLIASTCQ